MKNLNQNEMSQVSGGGVVSGIAGCILGYNLVGHYINNNNPWLNVAAAYIGGVAASGLAAWSYNEQEYAYKVL